MDRCEYCEYNNRRFTCNGYKAKNILSQILSYSLLRTRCIQYDCTFLFEAKVFGCKWIVSKSNKYTFDTRNYNCAMVTANWNELKMLTGLFTDRIIEGLSLRKSEVRFLLKRKLRLESCPYFPTSHKKSGRSTKRWGWVQHFVIHTVIHCKNIGSKAFCSNDHNELCRDD